MRDWHNIRGRFFRRVGGLFVFLSLLACGGLATLFWLLDLINAPTMFPHAGGPLRLVALVLVVAGLVLAVRALRRAALPVGDVMEATERVAGGDYSARIVERGPRETRALARAFNSMITRLQADDEQRRILLADVTHELRTPLTVIQGNLEGLLDGIYPRDDVHLSPILEETRILSRLIDDLRTLALAESGALQLQKEPTDLAMLVSDTVASFQAQADKVGLALSANAAPDLVLEVDPERIRQVLENLIANALRYTPQGGTIRVSCAAEGTRAVISVNDTGAGIPPDELAHIFDRFHKSRDSRGTGLGLAIARNLVVAHGGEISAHSVLGQGTTVRITLPLAGGAGSDGAQ
jgi:two-component system sensor histidine kinase BaeS